MTSGQCCERPAALSMIGSATSCLASDQFTVRDQQSDFWWVSDPLWPSVCVRVGQQPVILPAASLLFGTSGPISGGSATPGLASGQFCSGPGVRFLVGQQPGIQHCVWPAAFCMCTSGSATRCVASVLGVV